ncbi:protein DETOXIFICATION 30-like [Coffea eugenioides]|uniref:protein DETOXIFICATION 30-like n=1 Tax=Coffea eugenioides TaxID=49369 RepID=UPI000F606CCB|nr:protein DETOXIFICATION 30-like [Coffea eugenioides]
MKLRLGLLGAALMLNASWWFITIGQFLYVMSGNCGRSWSGFSRKALRNLSGFVKLSVSSAVMLSLEIWYIMALTLVVGHLKNAEVSVDALSICLEAYAAEERLKLWGGETEAQIDESSTLKSSTFHEQIRASVDEISIYVKITDNHFWQNQNASIKLLMLEISSSQEKLRLVICQT